jgi:hypothetical protein
MEEEILSVGTQTWLYICEDIFYLVTATIVLQNMMVEVRINKDETESVDFFDQAGTHHESDCDDNVCGDCSVVDTSVVGNFDTSSCRENILKYRIVQE